MINNMHLDERDERKRFNINKMLYSSHDIDIHTREVIEQQHIHTSHKTLKLAN